MQKHFAVVAIALMLPLCALVTASFLPAGAHGLEPAESTKQGPAWEQTKSIAAPEAHQAAAADEKYAYAITNSKIAKYDRKTDQRVATSTAKIVVKHLNSGFFHEGKLYCAHSNYPLKPEQSEIMLLDPASMEIAVFKDFGNFGGSLTWAIQRGEHWWCNFARYGSTNQETFLVRFDDKWNETGRWTYPDVVINQIGSASISGGVWHKDTLLVTDHDHGVLYRLQVPAADKKSTELEFIAQEKAPFTGQGIAHDPVTGGLVGINRAKKEILFAVPAKP
ncbi:hypothetical protein ETAA8_29710 [Anatilimnocola aggregata]|uniref:Endonuclease n=1 Tax=Anatilimnocola aggregata TaxID=2528021 RepID=A0A517YCB5_9BACT|nr:endonuclease [Anatilimnocola aggregata]QDU27880.1 hypothetical protein ETAA8_29710 [Anatilimnocola aggregata]